MIRQQRSSPFSSAWSLFYDRTWRIADMLGGVTMRFVLSLGLALFAVLTAVDFAISSMRSRTCNG